MSAEPADDRPRGGARRAKELFLDALELAGDQRQRFLERLGREDPVLGRRVGALLDAHEGTSQWVDALSAVSERLQSAGDPRPTVGSRLGDYELLEEVAAGASGVVWRARQGSLDRVVALKVLRAGRFAGPEELERFRAEAGAVARLDHVHIVPVYEVGEHEGHAFFSMKWIEGGSLDAAIGGGWEPRRAATLMATIARAVHHAHQRGFLHRDLKPSNVLLDAAGDPHVADFGVAKRLDQASTATGTQGLVGTPAYMAPEQTTAGGELTVATDVWALGCILFQLLAGRAPFEGESLTDVLLGIRDREPPALRELRAAVPRDLETVAGTCLRKEPGRRYASALALAEDLERWLAHEPIRARRASLPERALLGWRRSPLVASLGVLVATLVVTLAVGATWTALTLRARLRDSWLEQARATRLSGMPGSRGQALDLLARAAGVRTGQDLVDEAIACLALSGLRLESEWPLPEGLASGMDLDPALERWAWGDAEGSIHVARAGERADRLVLQAAEPVAVVRFSEDGRWLLARYASGGPTLPQRFRVWELASGRERLSAAVEVGYDAYDVDRAGGRAAVVSMQGELVLFDLSRGVEERRFDLGARAGSLRFDHAGERLLIGVGGDVRELQLRSVPEGALLEAVPLDASPFMVSWSAHGGRLAVACGDYLAYVREPGRADPISVLAGHVAEVVEVELADERPLGVTASWDQTTRVWDVDTGEQLLQLSAAPLRFTPDGRRLATRSTDSVAVWQLEHGGVLRELRGHAGKSPYRLALAGDDRHLVSGGPDGALLWDLEQGRQVARLSSEPFVGAVFLPDGERLLLAGAAGLERMPLADPTARERLLEGRCIALAADVEARLVAAMTEERVHLLRLDQRERDRELPRRPGQADLDLSPDGAWLVIGTWQSTGAEVWETQKGTPVASLLPDETSVTAAFSEDGRFLATSTSSFVNLWRVGTWDEVWRVPRRMEFASRGLAMAFTPDGARLAVADLPGAVTLLDVATGERVGSLEPPRLRPIVALAFSDAGTVLGAACNDNHLQVWDLAELERRLADLRRAR